MENLQNMVAREEGKAAPQLLKTIKKSRVGREGDAGQTAKVVYTVTPSRVGRTHGAGSGEKEKRKERGRASCNNT